MKVFILIILVSGAIQEIRGFTEHSCEEAASRVVEAAKNNYRPAAAVCVRTE